MREYKLRYRPKLSLKQAIAKISDFGIHGEHGFRPRPSTPKDVADFFLRKGIDPNRVAEACRNYRETIPFFENILKHTWKVGAEGDSKVVIVNKESGKETSIVGEPGELVGSSYQAKLELACEARDRAVEKASYPELLSALVHGFAAIEGFINDRAGIWSIQNSQDPLPDTKEKKVSLDDKIDLWIPKILRIAHLNKSNNRWEHFKLLKRMRDDLAVHQKSSEMGVTLRELAERINMFRSGLAEVLFQLHVAFGLPAPAVLINAVHMPNIDVIEVDS